MVLTARLSCLTPWLGAECGLRGQTAWAPSLALLQAWLCVASGSALTFSGPRFPHLPNGLAS